VKPATSRRGLLAAGATTIGLAPRGVGAEAPAPLVTAPVALSVTDRRLLGLHQLAQRQVAVYAGAMRAGWAADEARDQLAKAAADAEQQGHWRGYEQAIDEMAALPAEGMAGLAAKVAAIALFAEHLRSGVNKGEADLVESAAADAARQIAALGDPDAPATLGWPDEDMLAACDRWEDARAQLEDLQGAALLAPLDAAAWARCHVLQALASAALEDIIALPAVTLPGRQAKAAILIAQLAGRDEPLARLAASVACDAMGPRS
jgi:hypothetical protein